MTATAQYAPGSIVKTRGREWVVLPESLDDLLMVRPLGGSEAEVTGVCLDLEDVESAKFNLPDPSLLGDHLSCRLLRDAVRIGFRSSAGPFRSFGHLAFEPRPYQLVPLMMALKLNPVRMLIADDVGIGKTIEALLIAKEMMDRGEIKRMTVICLPHLADQWQREMRDKFSIDAELVLPGTIRRLESNLSLGQTIFEVYPVTIVSVDFIKSSRCVTDFVRTCPELVIVDEAHACASADDRAKVKHQRFKLIQQLAQKQDRNIILVTATPHSGNESAFRSLIGFLNPEFGELPEDLTGERNAEIRRHLAAHLIQRRRADIKAYLNCATSFPNRLKGKDEETYNLSQKYAELFKSAVRYARETVQNPTGSKFVQRVRWWSVLALLRSLASSPAAAAATLRSRAAVFDAETEAAADAIGRNSVFDFSDDDLAESVDVTPGADIEPQQESDKSSRRRLLEMAKLADSLKGDKDTKLLKLVELVKEFIKDGYNPIVFCRFIDTAKYVAEELRKRIGEKKAAIQSVTGESQPDEREALVAELAKFRDRSRVLVCTDCLSEGINLQQDFDAVIHYDLSWNPTRHEQREGRVDRFGQRKPTVRVLTIYGVDNQIDGIVLDVLLRKHKAIRKELEISVPIPFDSEKVVEAIFEGLLLRESNGSLAQSEMLLPGFDEYFKPQKEALHREWDNVSDKEKRSRSVFAQQSIKVGEVARELAAVRESIGSDQDIERFTKLAILSSKGIAASSEDGCCKIDIAESPIPLKEAFDNSQLKFKARFSLPVSDDEIFLHRTHPYVERLAGYVLDTALDSLSAESAVKAGMTVARRAGIIRTSKVSVITTLLLLRLRYHIITVRDGREDSLLAEDSISLAFEDLPAEAKWLSKEQADALYQTASEVNIPHDVASERMRTLIEHLPMVFPYVEAQAKAHGMSLLDAHTRVRSTAKAKSVRYRVEPCLPPDILGVYHFLPKPSTMREAAL